MQNQKMLMRSSDFGFILLTMRSSIFLLLSFLLVVSCAPVHVNYDYEKGTDFSRYNTYNYWPDMDMGLSELDTNRLIRIMDEAMMVHNLERSDNPDFLISIYAQEFQDNAHNNVGVGFGGGGGHVGGGISVGIPIGSPKINRKITFEFVDNNKSGLFWQATSESSYNPNMKPESKEDQLKKIVKKVLSKYPPDKKL